MNYDDPFGLCPPNTVCPDDYDPQAAFAGLVRGVQLANTATPIIEGAGVAVTAPLGGGIAATEEIGGSVLALGSTLESGAGSGLLTAGGVAGRVAEATGGVVSAMKGGVKVTVEAARDIVARIKATGDIRVSIDGIGSLTREGTVSSNRALTHLRNLSSDEITGLVNKARQFLGVPQ